MILIWLFNISTIISSWIKKECVPNNQVPLVEPFSLFPSIILHCLSISLNSIVVWYLLKLLSLGNEKSQSLCRPIVILFLLNPSTTYLSSLYVFFEKFINSKKFPFAVNWNIAFPVNNNSLWFNINLFLLFNLINNILLSLPLPEKAFI